MSIHRCKLCKKAFQRQANLNYHSNNKVCEKEQKDDVKKTYKCKYCDKNYTTPQSLSRHINHICKIKINHENDKKEIYQRLLNLENENKDLKKEVVELKKANVVINNIHNTNNGIVATINLIGYGNEDMSKINKTDIIKAIQQGFKSTLKLTEYVHFNPNYPEYHNIYIANVKNKYGMMYDGTDWKLLTKDKLINMIYDDKKNYIEENLDEFVESLSDSRQKALQRWLEIDDENEKITEIKDEMKLLLYNKRKVVMNDIGKKIQIDKKTIKSTKKTMNNQS